MPTFGEWLKCHRETLGISAYKLAQDAGVTRGYISNIERGVQSVPSDDVLERLAPVLGLPIEDLKAEALKGQIKPGDAMAWVQALLGITEVSAHAKEQLKQFQADVRAVLPKPSPAGTPWRDERSPKIAAMLGRIKDWPQEDLDAFQAGLEALVAAIESRHK